MTIASSRVLPMSLEDIASALAEIREDISALQASLLEAANNDVASLDQRVSTLENQLETIQQDVSAIQETVNSDDGSADALQNLEDRVDALEGVSNDFFGA